MTWRLLESFVLNFCMLSIDHELGDLFFKIRLLYNAYLMFGATFDLIHPAHVIVSKTKFMLT